MKVVKLSNSSNRFISRDSNGNRRMRGHEWGEAKMARRLISGVVLEYPCVSTEPVCQQLKLAGITSAGPAKL
jgi:hypothetical protein